MADHLLSVRGLGWVLVLWAATGCFYSPTVTDCSVACPAGVCPTGLQCVEGLCRSGADVACECQHGTSRPCGSAVGECRRGTQTCSLGTWGACAGEITPVAEFCDGRDNDCDGQTDQSPAVVLYAGATTDYQLLSYDGGHALVTYSVTDAGLQHTQVFRIGADLSVQGSVSARLGEAAPYVASAAKEQSVYLAWNYDGGISLSVVEGMQARALEDIPDASVFDQLRLGVGENIVAFWDVPGTHTMLARWTLQGQLREVTDTVTIDAGYAFTNAFTPSLSSQGHYAIWTSDSPMDAGLEDEFSRLLLDTRTMQILRVDAPYYQGSAFRAAMLEAPTGEVCSVYSYSYPSEGWSGVYFNPDILTLRTADELTLEEIKTNALAWGYSDATLDAEGRISIVYQDNIDSRLIMARSVPRSPQVVKRNLTRDDGTGIPKLGNARVDEFLTLAWRTSSGISARRICPVR